MAARILVVDDERPALKFCVEALRESYQVDGVPGFDEAVAALEESSPKSGGTPFALLVIDIALSEKDNGLSLAMRARDQFPDMPVVFITGVFVTDRQKAMEQPTFRFLEKPFSPEKLRDTVASCLKAASHRPT